MKLRLCFVSNSSSSSYVIIGDSLKLIDFYIYNSNTLDISDHLFEFGWGYECVRSIFARVAWAMLLINGGYTDIIKDEDGYPERLYTVTPSEIYIKYKNMLDEVIQEQSNLKLIWKLHPDSYLDHQSVDTDNINAIYKDKETLKQFIYNEKSMIILDNDNKW